MSEQLVAQQPLHEKLMVPQPIIELLSPVQQGWLLLCANRITLQKALEKSELEVQQLVAKGLAAGSTLQETQEYLRGAKRAADVAKDQRLHFTRNIEEKLFTPLTAYEKRNSEQLANLAEHELELRKAESEKQKAGQAKAEEEAAFKAFALNEQVRRKTAYVTELRKLVQDCFEYCLKGRYIGEVLDAALEATRGFMRELKLVEYNKFTFKHLSGKEAGDIFGAILKYTGAEDLEKTLGELNSRFAMYEQDLQNAEAAIAEAKQSSEVKAQEEANAAEMQQAANSLVSQAAIIDTPAVKLKQACEIVEENTHSYAVEVMSAFISNFQHCSKYLKIRDWRNLKLSQMGEALAKLHSETGQNFFNLKFKAVIK